MRPAIELHIGELILHGLPYAQRHRIAEALEQELARLLGERGLPPSLAQGGIIPQMNIGDLRLAKGARPGAIGVQIARQVYSSLTSDRAQAQGGSPSPAKERG